MKSRENDENTKKDPNRVKGWGGAILLARNRMSRESERDAEVSSIMPTTRSSAHEHPWRLCSLPAYSARFLVSALQNHDRPLPRLLETSAFSIFYNYIIFPEKMQHGVDKKYRYETLNTGYQCAVLTHKPLTKENPQ